MLCFSSIVAQLVENVPIELGMTFPSLCGDEIAVHHALLVDPLGAGLFDLEADVAVAGQLAPPAMPAAIRICMPWQTEKIHLPCLSKSRTSFNSLLLCRRNSGARPPINNTAS